MKGVYYMKRGLILFFSLLPGANYMYMGLIKRGLAAMCGFFLLIYFLTVVAGSIIGGPLTLLIILAMPVLILTCAFDSFNIRRRIANGEVVQDNIDDVINFLHRWRKPLLTILVICIGLGVFGSFISWIFSPLRHIFPWLIIGFGAYLLFKKKTG